MPPACYLAISEAGISFTFAKIHPQINLLQFGSRMTIANRQVLMEGGRKHADARAPLEAWLPKSKRDMAGPVI